MKILITGCHGQLGTELQKQLADEECALGPLPERLRKATVIAVDVDELDITDREATVTYIRRIQPDAIDIKLRYPKTDHIADIILHFRISLI